MTDRRVLLLVTGGIAVYKACLLTRLLVQAGLSVRVGMTAAAQRFVSPLTFQVLSGHPVATDLWGDGQGRPMDHIDHAAWADVAVMAPATANSLARAANGLADEIVSTLLLAFPGPLLVAPAMNDHMWRHPATQANLARLRERGVHVVGPGSGDLACGTVDVGRMAEPEEILAAIQALMALEGPRTDASPGTTAAAETAEPPAPAARTASGVAAASPWRGRRVLVTAGPTHEPVDAVRYLANRSSGALGYAIAAAAASAGAEVTLVSGPVQLLPPRGLRRVVHVQTAGEMAAAVAAGLDEGCDWLIMAAAVADFAPAQTSPGKLKKEALGDAWRLELVRTPDVLGDVVPRHRGPHTRVVGFALETEHLQERALGKLRSKQLDFVVANDPIAEGAFGPGEHVVHLIGPAGEIWQSERLPKPAIAAELLRRLARATAEADG
ncbi:MAG: bifunctional phosphopantothenoylcysteine decarboxylase/phosphopantothenate synthase [Candidatus Krumholzibacteriia bacterium]